MTIEDALKNRTGLSLEALVENSIDDNPQMALTNMVAVMNVQGADAVLDHLRVARVEGKIYNLSPDFVEIKPEKTGDPVKDALSLSMSVIEPKESEKRWRIFAEAMAEAANPSHRAFGKAYLAAEQSGVRTVEERRRTAGRELYYDILAVECRNGSGGGKILKKIDKALMKAEKAGQDVALSAEQSRGAYIEALFNEVQGIRIPPLKVIMAAEWNVKLQK